MLRSFMRVKWEICQSVSHNSRNFMMDSDDLHCLLVEVVELLLNEEK